jgi:CRISPR-associated protein Csm3
VTSAAEHRDFHALRQRLRLAGVIETRTALRIGSGGGSEFDASDLPVLRDGDGYPLLPGSSLKGVLRSTLEALVRAGSASPAVWSCDPNTREGGCGRHASGGREEALERAHCALCRLFGSQVLASHVRFSDAMLRDADSLKRDGRLPIEMRDGVAIDRDLRVVHGGQKYTFEVVSPGTRFDLEVFVENPDPWLMGLLVIGFDQVADGFTALGGFTSRGLGRVALRWEEMRTYDAAQLLAGGEPAVADAAAMKATFDGWRRALAHKLREV